MKPVPQDEVEKVARRVHDAPARVTLKKITDECALHSPDRVAKITIKMLKIVVDEIERVDALAAALASEVAAWRRNEQLKQVRSHWSAPRCLNCRFFVGVVTPVASREPVAQSIINQTGACAYGPPSLVQRAGPEIVFSSAFPPVHPDHWCGRFEQIGERSA